MTTLGTKAIVQGYHQHGDGDKEEMAEGINWLEHQPLLSSLPATIFSCFSISSPRGYDCF